MFRKMKGSMILGHVLVYKSAILDASHEAGSYPTEPHLYDTSGLRCKLDPFLPMEGLERLFLEGKV